MSTYSFSAATQIVLALINEHPGTNGEGLMNLFLVYDIRGISKRRLEHVLYRLWKNGIIEGVGSRHPKGWMRKGVAVATGTQMGLKAVFKGTISLGLVSIPVSAVSAIATEAKPKGHQVHDTDFGKIRHKKICENCNEEISMEHVKTAYQKNGEQVIVETSDLDVEATRRLDVKQFTDRTNISGMLLESPYWLSPDKGGEHGYNVLLEVLKKSGKAAVCQTAMRGKERIAMIRAEQDSLAMQMMRYPEQIRPAPDHLKTVVSADEAKFATQLVKQMVKDFDPSAYQDARSAAIKERVASASGVPMEMPEPASSPAVSSLLDALRQSVETTEEE